MLTPLTADRALFTGSAIEVYTSTLSAQAGDEVGIHVSTTAQRFALRVTRWGAEETTVWSRDDIPGEYHPTPDRAWEGCDWPQTLSITIPEDWRSGYYEVTATTAADGVPAEEFRAFFVVRASSPTARILFVLSTNTYAAYNWYGGGSLYTRHDGQPGNEHRVSIHRPWIPGFLLKPDDYDIHTESLLSNINGDDPVLLRNPVSGVPWLTCAAGFGNWERPAAAWLERNGYEVDYAVNTDLEVRPELLSAYRLMLAVGHDEYWSWGMRDTVESFIAGGGNVCFFTGDTSSMQVRLEDGGDTVVAYKDAYREDPVVQAGATHLATNSWSNPEVGRPESRMTGLTIWYAGFSRFHTIALNGPKGFLVYRPEHWIFDDTGVGYGDCIGTNGIILRYELDGCPIRLENGLPFPQSFHDAHPSLEILGMAPAAIEPNDFPNMTLEEGLRQMYALTDPLILEHMEGNHGHAAMAMYVNNGTVFAAGTTDWANGLKGGDPEIEQITRNLIDRLS
jgi:hypothetical protein